MQTSLSSKSKNRRRRKKTSTKCRPSFRRLSQGSTLCNKNGKRLLLSSTTRCVRAFSKNSLFLSLSLSLSLLFFPDFFLCWKKNVIFQTKQSTKNTRDKKGPHPPKKKTKKKFLFLDRFSFLFLKAAELSLFGHSTRHTRRTERERERERERPRYLSKNRHIKTRTRSGKHTSSVQKKTHLKNNHGDHVREIVPASLLEERDAHLMVRANFF